MQTPPEELKDKLVFKTGQFYAIQAINRYGEVTYCESLGRNSNHADRLKIIARKAARASSSYYDEPDDDVVGEVATSPNPFSLRTWAITSDVRNIIDNMRIIRKGASSAGIDPNSLKIVVVETSVNSYIPESPSDDETELRRFILEKLNTEEKKLLKVEHWEVYNKLADRSMLPDDDDNGD